VKPIPLQLIRHAVDRLQTDEFSRAVADTLIIGLFFLLRPGENTYNKENNHPFRLQDASFQSPTATTNATSITTAELDQAEKVHLNFTDQKNGEKNEAITHGDTSEPVISPLKAVRRRIEHLRVHQAPPDTPLYTVFLPTGTKKVTAGHLTNVLRTSCKAIGKQLGIYHKDISARALRAGGAMALLRANVDPTLIRLQGRWKSWAMLQYLHRSATNTTDFAERMIIGGTFIISKHATLPDDVASTISPAL